MKIIDIKTTIVNAEMRNWVFVKVITDKDLYGWGEATVEWKINIPLFLSLFSSP